MCCDQVHPRPIIPTTFTEKAARNLQDRIANTRLALTAKHQQLSSIDTSEARIGTLHSICNDVLQEYRFPAYQNVRLLDQAEADLFNPVLKPEDKHMALFDFSRHVRNSAQQDSEVLYSFATTSSRPTRLGLLGAMKQRGVTGWPLLSCARCTRNCALGGALIRFHPATARSWPS